MFNGLNFQDRIVVFVDILGFGSLVEQAAIKPDSNVSKRLGTALTLIKNLNQMLVTKGLDEKTKEKMPFFGMDPNLQMFSDSFFLSLEPTEESVDAMFRELSKLYLLLMSEGIWIRGGIAYGKMSTNHASPCGPAINSAYKIESQIANSPRIAFAKSFVDYCRENAQGILETDFVERDEDGVYALSPLRIATTDHNRIGVDLRNYAEQIRDHLNNSLEAIVDNPRHYNKVMKLANRWNWYCDEKKGFFNRSIRTKDYIDFVDTLNAAIDGND